MEILAYRSRPASSPPLVLPSLQLPAPRHTIILLPRYRRLEETIATRFGCQEVMDSALMRGFKAMRQWLTATLNTNPQSSLATGRE